MFHSFIQNRQVQKRNKINRQKSINQQTNSMSFIKTRPKKIQQYQVLDLLGKGGNGVVYKGIDMTKGTFVAIKEIVIEKTEIKNIKFQINVLKEFNDPFIVKYIDAIQCNNKIYLVLEYLQGGSLGSLVQKTPLQEKLVKKYIKQVLKGLQYLHKHHVAHRDLKGTNILLTKQGKAKITDFGVAIQVNDTQKTLSSAGTPYWMAPEAIINESATNVQCDIWSLGCTVIELLTGNPPYHDLMPYPALFRIVQDSHPPIPENITSNCADFLMRCFIKDPKNRASATQLLKHKWIKQGNQHNSSSFSVDIQNMVLQNDTKISTLIKSCSWQQLYELTLNTTNRKTIYYNKSFVLIKKSENTDQKLKFIKQLIVHSHEALKYLSTIGVIRSIIRQELREGWRITKLKLIEFLCQAYELCEQSNDLLIWLSEFLIMYKHLMFYMGNSKSQWHKRIVHIAKMLDLLYKLINSGLLIDQHLFQMLEDSGEDDFDQNNYQQQQQINNNNNLSLSSSSSPISSISPSPSYNNNYYVNNNTLNVFHNLLMMSEFMLGLKNSQISFHLVSLVKKHINYGKQFTNGLRIYFQKNNSLLSLIKLSQCFYDFRVLFQFITLFKTVISIPQFKRYFEKNTIILNQTTKTLSKLISLPTVTMEEHQILLELIEFLTIYLNGSSPSTNKQLTKLFIQLGGIKTLTAMPDSYTKNQKIYQNVSGLIQLLDV